MNAEVSLAARGEVAVVAVELILGLFVAVVVLALVRFGLSRIAFVLFSSALQRETIK